MAGVFSELNVSIGADTADFNAGMSRAGSVLDDVRTNAVEAAGAMNFLSSRTDKAGDEMTELSFKSAAASGSLNNLGFAAGGATGGVTSLSSVLTLSLIPALVTVAGALVPIVTALSGLAIIGGSIAGVGIIGAMAALATNTEQLKEQAMGIVSTLQEEFSFAIEMATTVLSLLMDEFERIIPELVPANDVVREIASLFGQLGTALIDALPALVDFAVTITREFLPGMVELARNVLPEVPGFLQTLVDTFTRLIPAFERAIGLIIDLGPELLEFGFTALNVVVPALERLTTVVIDGLEWFNSLKSSIQDIGMQLSIAAPIIAGVASILGGPVTLAIAAAVGGFILFKDEIMDAVGVAIGLLNDFVAEIEGINFDDLINDSTIQNIISSFEGLRDQAVGFLGELASSAERVFGRVMQVLRDNEPQIRNFADAAGNAFAGVVDVLGEVLNAARTVLDNFVIPIVMRLVGVLDEQLGPTITSLTNLIDRWATILRVVGQVINQVFQNNREEITAFGKLITDIVGTAVVNAFDILLTTVRTLSELFQGDLGQAFQEIVGLGERMFDRFTTLLENWGIIEAFQSTIDSIADTVLGFFTAELPGQFIAAIIRLVGMAESGLSQLQNTFISTFNSIVDSVVGIMTDLVNAAIVSPLNNSIGRIQSLISQLPQDQVPSELTGISQIEQIDAPTVEPLQTQQPRNANLARTEAAQNLAANLNINIEGDGQLAEIIRENANIAISQQERRADRTRNRGSGV